MLMRLSFFLIFIAGSLLAEDEVVLKVPPTTVVAYRLQLACEFKQNMQGDLPPAGMADLAIDFDVGILSGSQFPEMLVVLHGLKYAVQASDHIESFDSYKDTGNPLFLPFPLARILNKPVKLPLTEDLNILSAPSSQYPMLPLENPEDYISFVKVILPFLKEGVHYTKGDGISIDAQYGSSKVYFKSALEAIKKHSLFSIVKYDVNLKKGMFKEIPELALKGSADFNVARDNPLLHQIEGDMFFRLGELESHNFLKVKYSLVSIPRYPDPSLELENIR